MKPGRNESCPCGSGKKYKHCHEDRQNHPFLSRGTIALIVPLVLLFGFAIYASLRNPETVSSVRSAAPVSSTPVPAPAASPTQASNAVAAPGSQFTPAPQPPGPPPAGKVWSIEHGHWHNAVSAGSGANGIQVSSQQVPMTDEQVANLKRLNSMPPPSSNLPVASANGPIAATAPLSNPPHATPPGKVWSPEHGHFHDVEPPTGVSGVRVLGRTIDPNSGAVSEPKFTPAPQPPGPVPAGKVWSTEHGHWHDAPLTRQ